jgi:chemotaxis protein MotB
MESDRQILEESVAMLKESKEEDAGTVSPTYEELVAEMKREIERGQIAVTELQGKLTVDAPDRLLFDPGRAEIKRNGSAVLKRVFKILKTVTDKRIQVEGHTDNVPIKGALAKKYPTNRELSAARALNVTGFMEKEGIDPSILSASAFGEYRPVAGNDTPEGRAKNGRITIILLPMK